MSTVSTISRKAKWERPSPCARDILQQIWQSASSSPPFLPSVACSPRMAPPFPPQVGFHRLRHRRVQPLHHGANRGRDQTSHRFRMGLRRALPAEPADVWTDHRSVGRVRRSGMLRGPHRLLGCPDLRPSLPERFGPRANGPLRPSNPRGSRLRLDPHHCRLPVRRQASLLRRVRLQLYPADGTAWVASATTLALRLGASNRVGG